MPSNRQRSGIKNRRSRESGSAKISARVVVAFVVASLLVGALAISLNVKLEEQEIVVPHPLARH
jgi:hypothetical protein